MPVSLAVVLADCLSPVNRELFMQGALKELGDMDFSRWMREDTAISYTTTNQGWHAPGALSVKVAGADFPLSAIRKGDKAEYVQVEYAKADAIASDMAEFWTPAQGSERMIQLGISGSRTKNRVASVVLTGGFTNVGPDGVSLFSTSHPGLAGLRSNRGSSALGHASLAAAIAVLLQQKNYEGNENPAKAMYLHVHPTNWELAKQLCGSDFTSDQLQINGKKGCCIPVVNPFFTDTNDWMVTGDRMDCRLRMYTKREPIAEGFVDARSDSVILKVRGMWVAGYDAFDGTFGASVN